jgi:site-specific DNA recombinase
MKTKAFGYYWISPELYDQDTRIIQAKRKLLEAHCRQKQLQFCQLHVDLALVKNVLERPELKTLLQTLQTGEVLIVESLMDLGRRFHDVYSLLELFRQGQIKGGFMSIREEIYLEPRNIPSFFVEILPRVPQLKSGNQRLRLIPTVPRQRSEVSRQNGGACPYGYTVNPTSNEYECHPEEAKVVARIFRERAAGRSLRQIAMGLTHAGIQTKRGGRWQANTIKTILENIFYTGCYQTHFKSFDNHHPPVIDRELFYRVNHSEAFDDIAL